MGRHAAREPCPFCRHPYTDLRDYRSPTHPNHHKFWIRCCGCDATGPKCDSKTEATEGWNDAHRTPEPVALPLDLPRS